MKCYEHAKTGETKDAVAVCAECGMGLCMEHVNEREVPIQHQGNWVQQTTMHILCDRCVKALGLNTQ